MSKASVESSCRIAVGKARLHVGRQRLPMSNDGNPNVTLFDVNRHVYLRGSGSTMSGVAAYAPSEKAWRMRLSVVLIALACGCSGRRRGRVVAVTAAHRRRRHGGHPGPSAPPSTTVAALGRIEPRSEVINLGSASTDVLTDLAVGRGSPVHAGEVLGHFRGYEEAVARERTATQQLGEARAQRQTEEALGPRASRRHRRSSTASPRSGRPGSRHSSPASGPSRVTWPTTSIS